MQPFPKLYFHKIFWLRGMKHDNSYPRNLNFPFEDYVEKEFNQYFKALEMN